MPAPHPFFVSIFTYSKRYPNIPTHSHSYSCVRHWLHRFQIDNKFWWHIAVSVRILICSSTNFHCVASLDASALLLVCCLFVFILLCGKKLETWNARIYDIENGLRINWTNEKIDLRGNLVCHDVTSLWLGYAWKEIFEANMKDNWSFCCAFSLLPGVRYQ